RWAAGKHRLQVLTGKQQDPFDSYGWMSELHYEYDLKPIYFFHVGQRRNQYDKNIPTSNKEYQQLIRITAAKNKIGLHPSWYSGDEMKMLSKEKAILEKISLQGISCSRQHYIRFTIPGTFRQLMDTDIYEDYSMGYGTVNGFRASVTVPFYWYDLEREQETHLLLHPFCFMDANSFYEQKQTSAEALKELMDYYIRVKEVDGTLTIIWHNTFLGNDPLYKGWREVYEAFLRQIHEEENASFFLKNG
ncbi:MAG TPA: polysaccharide deacetylase family protein, partial [Chitinophagaceae bacterium]